MEISSRVTTNLNLQHVFASQANEPDWPDLRAAWELNQKAIITHAPGTCLFAISVKNPDPNVAAKIANTIASTYQEYRLQEWKEIKDVSDGAMPAIAPVTIEDIARPDLNSAMRTKSGLFLRWVFGGTLLALVAGGGGALISLVVRPHCHPDGSTPH